MRTGGRIAPGGSLLAIQWRFNDLLAIRAALAILLRSQPGLFQRPHRHDDRNRQRKQDRQGYQPVFRYAHSIRSPAQRTSRTGPLTIRAPNGAYRRPENGSRVKCRASCCSRRLRGVSGADQRGKGKADLAMRKNNGAGVSPDGLNGYSSWLIRARTIYPKQLHSNLAFRTGLPDAQSPVSVARSWA